MPNKLTKSEIRKARNLISKEKKYKNYSKTRKKKVVFGVAWKIHRAKRRK